MRRSALGCIAAVLLAGCAGTDATGLAPQEVDVITAPKTRCAEVREEVGSPDGVIVRCAPSDESFIRQVTKACRDDPAAMESEPPPFLLARRTGEVIVPDCTP